MKSYNFSLYNQIARMITALITYLTLLKCGLCVYANDISNLYLLGIPAFLILFLIIQRYCYHLPFYIILHATTIPICIFVPAPNNTIRIMYGIMLLFEFSHAKYIWKHNKEKSYNEAPWELYFLMILIYILTYAYGYKEVANWIYLGGTSLLILHFLRYYMEGVSHVVEGAKESSDLPIRKMLTTSNILILFLLITLVVAGIFVRCFFPNSYMDAIGAWIVSATKTLFYGLGYIATMIRVFFAKNRSNEDVNQTRNNLQESLHETAQLSSLAQIINTITIVLFYVITILVIYVIISNIYHSLRKRFAKDYEVVIRIDKKTTIKDNKKEDVTPLAKKRKTLRLDNNLKVRRYYKHFVKKHNDFSPGIADTTSDIAVKIETEYEENMDNLTILYQQARYGNQEITKQDLYKGGLL